MAGPIFAENDPVYRGVKLPKQFWKAIYFRETGDRALKAKTYVLTQSDLLNELEALELPEFSVYEVPISKIAEMTGLLLPSASEEPTYGRGKEAKVLISDRIRRIASVTEIANPGE